METAFLFILTAATFVVIGATIVIGHFFRFGKKKDASPYVKRPAFFDSRREFELFNTVAEVCGAHYYVFPHVHLGRVLDVKEKVDWKERSNYRSRIDRKPADMVIGTRATVEVVAVVELGSESHNFPDKKTHNRFIDDLANVGTFPLIDLRLNMDREAVRAELSKFLQL